MNKSFLLLVFTVLAILSFGSTKAQANEMAVSDLQQICAATDDGSKNACQFYIFGVFEGANTAAGALGDKTHFCLPEGLSSTEMTLAVKQKIDEDLEVYPADGQLAAAGFVLAVMVKTFPCHDSN